MNNKGLFSKKIPTVVGLLILIAGLIVGVFLVNNRQGFNIKAGPTESPKNVRITNLGTNTFTISWTTDSPVTGFLKYSEDPGNINTPGGDVRDQVSGTSTAYTNHYVNVTNLKADTTYYAVIGSGPQIYTDEGKPFQIRTGPQVIPPPEDIIYGKILDTGNNPANGAIVFVDLQGAESLSTMTKTDGTWRLNLASARTPDKQVAAYDTNTALISVFVQGSTGGTATAISNTSLDTPIPDIALGKNQNFVNNTVETVDNTNTTNTGDGFGGLAAVPTESVTVITNGETESGPMQILNPAIDGEMIATSSPEIKGTALPGTDIQISVHSTTEMSAMIKADKNGLWSWTPPAGLEPGLHTVTLEYTDPAGVPKTIIRNFTVLAAENGGGLPAFTATPSASITPSITLTPSTTITPTLTATLTPTATITPTLTLTPTPTTDNGSLMPATNSADLTNSGTLETTLVLLGIAAIMVFGGQMIKRKYDY